MQDGELLLHLRKSNIQRVINKDCGSQWSQSKHWETSHPKAYFQGV